MMLRCVAVFLCVATSQGLKVQVPDTDLKISDLAEEQSVLEAAVQEGITWESESDESTDDVIDTDGDVDPNAKVDEKDDDMARAAKSAKVETKVIKEGDGKTFPAKGDKVKIRVYGTMKMKHFHDQQVDGIYEYTFPMAFPSAPGGGGANPMNVVKDKTNKVLPTTSLGSHVELAMSSSDGESASILELLEITKAGTESAPEVKETPTIIRVLAKQKAAKLTMQRKVLKEGDGKTFAQKGDTVTVRQAGCQGKGAKKICSSIASTYEYPLLAEPYTMKVKGFKFGVKFSVDEKIAPELSEGGIQDIGFDSVKVRIGAFKGPTYKFPTFTFEMVKIQKKN